MPEETPEPVQAGAVPLAAAETPLPELKRVLATQVIERENGPDIAPGQIAWLPKDAAAAAIKAGKADDPDKPAKAAAKTAADQKA